MQVPVSSRLAATVEHRIVFVLFCRIVSEPIVLTTFSAVENGAGCRLDGDNFDIPSPFRPPGFYS